MKNNRYFDPKMGAAGAAIMGAAVYYVNSEYSIDLASIAAAKQAAYTFLMGGVMMKMCENLSTSLKNRHLSKTLSSLVPSAATIGLTYLIHSLKGTPEPFESTVPTVIAGPIVFTFWGNRKRNQLEKKLREAA